jgi:hypothetical protein
MAKSTMNITANDATVGGTGVIGAIVIDNRQRRRKGQTMSHEAANAKLTRVKARQTRSASRSADTTSDYSVTSPALVADVPYREGIRMITVSPQAAIPQAGSASCY